MNEPVLYIIISWPYEGTDEPGIDVERTEAEAVVKMTKINSMGKRYRVCTIYQDGTQLEVSYPF